MATLAETITAICDDLDRPVSEIGAAVTREIQKAVDFYKGMGFWFTQEETSWTLTAAVASYPFATTAAFASKLPIEIDILKVLANNRNDDCDRIGFAEFTRLTAYPYTGIPDTFCIHKDTLYIAPTPQQAYVATLYYTAKYPTLMADGDTNPWLVEGNQLIHKHAMMQVARNKLRDDNYADRLSAELVVLVGQLHDETRARESSGVIRGHD